MRIVSLLPSATEMICGIGLEDALVGISHECDHPPSIRHLPRVTESKIAADANSADIDQQVRESLDEEQSLYHLNGSALESLRPDLIVTQTLCEVCAVGRNELERAISGLDAPPQIVHLEPTVLEDVLCDIERLGKATDRMNEALTFSRSLRDRIERVRLLSETIKKRPRVITLEWLDPPFSAGHWNPELVQLAGGDELLGRPGEKSQTILWDDVFSSDPDALLIACCGFDIERAFQDLSTIRHNHDWNALRCVREKRVFVFDGSSYFNRPGPRLIDGLEFLAAVHIKHAYSRPILV